MKNFIAFVLMFFVTSLVFGSPPDIDIGQETVTMNVDYDMPLTVQTDFVLVNIFGIDIFQSISESKFVNDYDDTPIDLETLPNDFTIGNTDEGPVIRCLINDNLNHTNRKIGINKPKMSIKCDRILYSSGGLPYNSQD
jgi:hypothetical protein